MERIRQDTGDVLVIATAVARHETMGAFLLVNAVPHRRLFTYRDGSQEIVDCDPTTTESWEETYVTRANRAQTIASGAFTVGVTAERI